MSERYFGNVVSAIDKYTIVMDKGAVHGVKPGDHFLVVSLGPPILDLVTHEEIERLEIVRGKVSIIHIQDKISTARSCELMTNHDMSKVKESRMQTDKPGLTNIADMKSADAEFFNQDGERLKALEGAQIGDLLIKL